MDELPKVLVRRVEGDSGRTDRIDGSIGGPAFGPEDVISGAGQGGGDLRCGRSALSMKAEAMGHAVPG
ncbi:hypothetical protein ACFY7C_12065 [Streptomyces sp. NPDC012769]|uniref:hypothetical protein n=1 Tax=Streptomyces sp. NPDC012769 TaxID=3364848 RepID=UPI00367D34A1